MNTKIRGLKVFHIFFGLLLGLQMAQPANANWFGGDIYSGGGDVPTPFEGYNRKYELADGEIYALPGKFVSGSSVVSGKVVTQTYFAVEMEKYSWLTNSKGEDFRFYRLEGPSDNNRIHYSLFKGTFLCRAHGRILSEKSGDHYVIYLEPIY